MENDSSAAARYSRGAIAFHWIIAVLIIMNFVIAKRAESLPDAESALVIGYHKAFGISILLLTLGRIIWRFTHKPPPLVETLKSWEAAIAKVTHALFYFLMLAVPLAGWGMHSAARGTPVDVFGLFAMPALPVPGDKPTIGLFHEMHEVFAKVMFVLLVLHILAALKHHFMDRDGTMRRMIPWMR